MATIFFPTVSATSMSVQPPLTGYSFAMYPTAISQGYSTRVLKFLNDTEQRWVKRLPLFGVTISYHGLDGYSMSVLNAFYAQVRGEYVDPALVNVFSMILAGNQYNYLTFDSPLIETTVEAGEKFSVQFKVRQIRPN